MAPCLESRLLLLIEEPMAVAALALTAHTQGEAEIAAAHHARWRRLCEGMGPLGLKARVERLLRVAPSP